MLEYTWDETKNEWLKEVRGISFEQILYHINHGDLIATVRNPNQRRYLGQRLYLVAINGYAWVVPFDRTGTVVTLRTAYPSREYTEFYLW